jgi:hypothetical protein
MRGLPSKVEVVVGDPLPLYRLEILKEFIRKVGGSKAVVLPAEPSQCFA